MPIKNNDNGANADLYNNDIRWIPEHPSKAIPPSNPSSTILQNVIRTINTTKTYPHLSSHKTSCLTRKNITFVPLCRFLNSSLSRHYHHEHTDTKAQVSLALPSRIKEATKRPSMKQPPSTLMPCDQMYKQTPYGKSLETKSPWC
jgi:hypothetical protein